MSRKLISFDWAIKKSCDRRIIIDILEGFLSELFKFDIKIVEILESVHQIFPEYFVIRVNKFNDKTKNRIDEWIYFLKNEMIRDDFKAKGLKKAKETLDIMKLNDKERIAYNRKLENKSLEKVRYLKVLDGADIKTQIGNCKTHWKFGR